jgi:hypothetical protein
LWGRGEAGGGEAQGHAWGQDSLVVQVPYDIDEADLLAAQSPHLLRHLGVNLRLGTGLRKLHLREVGSGKETGQLKSRRPSR